MFTFLFDFFQKKRIDTFGTVPLTSCRIIRPHLLERVGIQNGTAILFAVPYFSSACLDPERNLSAYAVSRDYHVYFSELFEELLPLLRARFPHARFSAFSDHSPIAEVEAAAKAGLGVIGKNRLLLTEKYSSYIFLGEIITDMILECKEHPVRACSMCGACEKNCPMETLGECLSALTQKKGDLTANEQNALRAYKTVWGCDRCQESCPHTARAIHGKTIFSPIPFFQEAPISCLTQETLSQMNEEEFSKRAYAWRKKDTILRNLRIFEDTDQKGDLSC